MGVRLRAYSLWHWLQLDAVDHPLLVGGDITLQDMRSAVRVLSSRWPARTERLPLACQLREIRVLATILWQLRRTGASVELLTQTGFAIRSISRIWFCWD
jgi:hypothetical protein